MLSIYLSINISIELSVQQGRRQASVKCVAPLCREIAEASVNLLGCRRKKFYLTIDDVSVDNVTIFPL